MPFFRYLFILFLVVPLVEIYFLVQVGEVIGAFPTVLLVVGTAALGVFLLRLQGLATLARFQGSLQQGELPATTLLEGLMLFIAGALLLTPGFVTDGFGFLLLIPPLRQALARAMMTRGVIHAAGGRPGGSGAQPGNDAEASRNPKVIEGEYERRDD